MMMKKIIINVFFIVFLLTLCISFNSCEKDGIYNPKQKISKIYADYSSGETFRQKQLVQSWTWDKNNLSKIDYWDMGFWIEEEPDFTSEVYQTDKFLYKKDRLIKIDHGKGYYSNITYNGANYDKMESFDDSGNLWFTAEFSYKNNKISKISMVQDIDIPIDKTIERKFLSSFLPKEFVPMTVKQTENVRKTKGINSIKFDANYTYNGDNIKETTIKLSYMGINLATITVTYVSHDKKQNPFYKKLEMIKIPELGIGMVGITSKNNPIEVKAVYAQTFGGEPEISITKISYVYKNDFPIEAIEANTSFSEMKISKLYFEYK